MVVKEKMHMKCEINKENDVLDKIVGLLTTLLLSSFYIFASDVWGAYVMIGIAAIIFLVFVCQNGIKNSIKVDAFHFGILAFVIYVIMSAFWAWNSGLAISKAITIFEILICTSVLYLYYNTETGTKKILNIIMWSGFIVTLYTFWKYGFSYISSFVQTSSRLPNLYANINTISMCATVSVIIAVYQALYKKISISLIMCLPAIYLIAATGSRKSFVMLIGGIAVLLLIRCVSDNIAFTVLRILLVCVLLYISLPSILELEIFSGVNKRMEGLIALFTGNGNVDNSALVRQQFNLIGLNQFMKTPFLGIGIGNSSILLSRTIGNSTYLHNNYVELLACGGAIGLIIYYRIYLAPIRVCVKNIRSKNPETIVCLILMVIFLAMDYGAVSYYSKSTYFYIMLFYIQMNTINREKKEENEQELFYDKHKKNFSRRLSVSHKF